MCCITLHFADCNKTKPLLLFFGHFDFYSEFLARTHCPVFCQDVSLSYDCLGVLDEFCLEIFVDYANCSPPLV